MRRMLGAFLVLLLLAGSSSQSFAQSSGNDNRVIVVFEPGVGADEQVKIAQSHGATPVKPLRLINATVVTLPDAAARARLSSDRSVVRIDDDVVVTALGKPGTNGKGKPQPSQPVQTLPWGIDRIDADLVWPTYTGAGIKVGVVDTGIDVDHADLMGNLKGGVNTTGLTNRKLTNFNDDNGHGTHVAGTIAAANNSIGVVGGAPGADLYAIKVLGSNGSGNLSDIIEGLEWAIDHGMQVVNMSLGTSSNIQSFHDAVIKVYNAGIVQVAAAGNSGGSVGYPAAYPEVIAVSAIDSGDKLAGFSSFGSAVDLTAPGVSIYSTYNDGLYTTLSGTSMASPHVAGTAALVLAAKGSMTPDQLSAHLKSTATPLAGLTSDQQGAGLVNAFAAVQ